IAPESDDAVWAVATDWGIVHTTDGGATWEWLCEEALATPAVYDVEALSADEALVATPDGLLDVDGACAVTPVPGLPLGAQGAFLEAAGDRYLVSAYAEGVSGLWACTGACVETGLEGDGVYVKSVAVDGATWWATTVHATTLDAALLRSVDEGATWETVA